MIPLSNRPLPDRDSAKMRLGIVKLHRTWWLTLLFAYLISFLWLGGFIVCVPCVIGMAPLGLTSLFLPPPDPAAARSSPGPVEIWLHVVFWSLFFVGAFGCRKLPEKVITGIYVCIVIMLLLTLSGCAMYYHWAGLNIN